MKRSVIPFFLITIATSILHSYADGEVPIPIPSAEVKAGLESIEYDSSDIWYNREKNLKRLVGERLGPHEQAAMIYIYRTDDHPIVSRLAEEILSKQFIEDSVNLDYLQVRAIPSDIKYRVNEWQLQLVHYSTEDIWYDNQKRLEKLTNKHLTHDHLVALRWIMTYDNHHLVRKIAEDLFLRGTGKNNKVIAVQSRTNRLSMPKCLLTFLR